MVDCIHVGNQLPATGGNVKYLVKDAKGTTVLATYNAGNAAQRASSNPSYKLIQIPENR